jgi:hypothetical protein
MDLFASLFFSPGHCSRSFFFSAMDGATLIVGADHRGRPEVRESGSAMDGATQLGAEHRVGPHMLKF